MPNPAEPAGCDVIREQLGDAYDRFDAEQRLRHVELLESIQHPQDAQLLAQRLNGDRWQVTVCTADCVGVLSIISGLFTANRIDIISGDVFTLDFEQRSHRRPTDRSSAPGRRTGQRGGRRQIRRKALDIFDVRTSRQVDDGFWHTLRDDLARLVTKLAEGERQKAHEEVIDRVSEAARAAPDSDERLFPVTVTLDNEVSPNLTVLYIQSTDTLGFVFEFAGALSMLNLNIERVEIRTDRHEVHDAFWVSDAKGKKIVQEERLHELRVAATLIKQFTHLLPRSPNPSQALRQFSALTGQMLSRPDWTRNLESLESGAVLRTIAELMGVSEFLWEDFLRMQHENLFPVLRDVPALDQAKPKDRLGTELEQELRGAREQDELVCRLNQFKDREMFRIDLRHITRRIGFVSFSVELTDLTEVIVGQAATLCHASVQERFGVPTLEGGRHCPWCVCALGKFGGREMGFASDVELLFVYEHDGFTEGPERVENSQYFEGVVSTFLQTLSARQEGIFEIDLRLRPYGKAGSLACSLPGFRKYFSEQGPAEQFERMALAKLRPVAGDAALGRQIMQARDAFVYSGRPIDYANILHLRRRQASELVQPKAISAKHSPGGLVDLEYFVQARQIEVGQAEPGVRVTGTLKAIEMMESVGRLDGALAQELRATYGFLRRLIDALRVVRGHAKDLTIPPAESREFAYLARRLQYQSSERLQQELAGRMSFAAGLWDELRSE